MEATAFRASAALSTCALISADRAAVAAACASAALLTCAIISAVRSETIEFGNAVVMDGIALIAFL